MCDEGSVWDGREEGGAGHTWLGLSFSALLHVGGLCCTLFPWTSVGGSTRLALMYYQGEITRLDLWGVHRRVLPLAKLCQGLSGGVLA